MQSTITLNVLHRLQPGTQLALCRTDGEQHCPVQLIQQRKPLIVQQGMQDTQDMHDKKPRPLPCIAYNQARSWRDAGQVGNSIAWFR